jgi:hypothetical protein
MTDEERVDLILLAWAEGLISEGHAARAVAGGDRVKARGLRADRAAAGYQAAVAACPDAAEREIPARAVALLIYQRQANCASLEAWEALEAVLEAVERQAGVSLARPPVRSRG